MVVIGNTPQQVYNLYIMIFVRIDSNSHIILGATYKGNALSDTQEGNLVYIDDNQASYSADLYKLEDGGEDNTISKKNNTNARLVEFVKALSQINPSDATDAQHPGAIANLVDPKPTLTHIAINFLIGSWDGFWYQASNYYLNQDFGLNKWYLITYDFDEVFGNGVEDAGMNTVAYQNYSKPGSQRPLVTVFLNNTYYQGVFEDTLKTIVKKFFKPSVIDARLKAWEQMLAEDITWSRAISSQSPGTKTTFTLQDFKDGLLGTNGSTISISQWVTKRAEALTTQLNFKDTDDLPAIGPYTNGTHLDSNGNVVNGDGSSANGTSSGSNGSNGSDSSQSSASNRLTITGLTVASAFAVAALLL
jgi:hypothetical protein